MLQLLLLLFGFSCVGGFKFEQLNALRPQVSNEIQEQAVRDLLQRLLPNHHNQFLIKVAPNDQLENGYTRIEKSKEYIKISGNSGPDVGYGIHRYLRSCCGAHFSWDGNQLSLPTVLPLPKKPVEFHSVGKLRYFGNVCTFSYTFAFWDWAKWERFIDWLALQGFNLPLAHVGQEVVFAKVWRHMGLTQAEIDEHFTGPAFFAWNRMGNLKKWGGPLSSNWYTEQMMMQKKILSRMVSLGMTPVLPAFPGHVPDAIKRRFVFAKITEVSCWVGFNHTYSCVNFLDPTDPLFQVIAKETMKQTEAVYGLYHAYSADSFNEVRPSSFDHDYLKAVTKAIYDGMASTDPAAVWVMQGWLFLDSIWLKDGNAEALLTAIEPGKMLLLDLFSEAIPIYPKVDSYYGRPWVWNMLHNFGGKTQLRGSARGSNEEMTAGLAYKNSTMYGTGLTMEGIYQNYAIYQFTIDRAWSQKELNTTEWIDEFSMTRYGEENENIRNAWRILWDTAYDEPVDVDLETGLDYEEFTFYSDNDWRRKVNNYSTNLLIQRPSLYSREELWYSFKTMCTIADLFAKEANRMYRSDLYRLDAVDIIREWLGRLATELLLPDVIDAYNSGDVVALRALAGDFLRLMNDTDTLMNTHTHFQMGAWIKEARAKGNDTQEADQYELNIRNQVTLWGPDGQIHDYARKDWAGLLSDFHYPRWATFFQQLEYALVHGTKFDHAQYLKYILTHVERPFTYSKAKMPESPVGDLITILVNTYGKYRKYCD